jgi:hypothetical protein
LDGLNEDREVLIWEESESIIEVGVGCTFGPTSVISGLVVGSALVSTGTESFVKRLEDLKDNEAGEGWREGIPLWETIFLDEKVECAIWSVEKAFVRSFVHQVKVMDKAVKCRFGFNFVSGGFSRHLIPTID